MTYEMDGQLSLFDPDGWSGKMSQDHSLRQVEKTKEKISGLSLKKSPGLKTRMPQYLDLRTANGRPADASWGMAIPSVGEFSIYSTGEQPTSMMTECRLNSEHRRGVGESRLSQILTPNGVHPKYYLSEAACTGILRRAENRGKELPEILKKALLNQASVSRNEQGDRGGKGILTQVGHTGALVAGNNQNVVDSTYSIDEKMGQTYVHEEQANTLAARDYKQPQAVNAYGFDQGATRDVGKLFYEEKSKTLANGSCPGHHNGVVQIETTNG